MKLMSMIALGAMVAVGGLSAQTSERPTTAKSPRHPLLPAYQLVRRNILAYADTMPAEFYDTRVDPDVRSFGELLGHTVLTNFGVCAGARREDNPRRGQKFEGVVTAKAELLPLLQASFAYCDPAVAALNPDVVAGSDLSFLVIHNAQMVAALEMYLVMQRRSPALTEMRRTTPAGGSGGT